MAFHTRQPNKPVASRPRGGLVFATALILVVAAGCSRSMGEFERTTANPIAISPAAANLPATGTAPTSIPPTALAPEEGAGVATLGTAAAGLPVDVDQTVTGSTPEKRLLTPEEKARIIAELEALAKRQANY